MGDAFVHSTGASDVFIGLLNSVPRITAAGAISNFTPHFAGTTALPPTDDQRVAYASIMSDLAGGAMSYDEAFNSAEGLIDLDFNRLDQAVIDAVRNIWPIVGATPGTWRDSDVGTLQNTEGFGFPVWLRNKRRGVQAMVDSGMHAGIRWFGCRLVSCQRKPGNQDQRWHMVLHARAIRSSGPKGDGIWQLFSHEMKEVANLNTN